MVDKVKPLKIETGSETDFAPTEANPSEDYLSCKGVSFEDTDTVFIDKSGNNLRFQDLVVTSPVTLSQLLFLNSWQYNQSVGLTTTTSTTVYTTKVTITTPSLSTGEYLIGWNAKLSTSSSNRSVQFEFRQGTTVLETGQAFSANASGSNHFSGQTVLALTGVHTFDFRFRVGTNGTTTARCENGLIYIYRVS